MGCDAGSKNFGNWYMSSYGNSCSNPMPCLSRLEAELSGLGGKESGSVYLGEVKRLSS